MADNSTDTPRRDVHQRITDQIIAAIEAGAGPAEMPWHRSGVTTTCPTNAFSGEPYHGVNIISLWAASAKKNFSSGHWATFKQWRCLDAHVRKGEKGSPIVFYKRYVAGQPDDRAGSNEDGAGPDGRVEAMRSFARTSWVFNTEQVDGWSPPKPSVRSPAEVVSHAEEFVDRTGATIHHGGDRACYRPSDDTIEMPARDAFTGTATSGATESYYAILFHELTHWSGHRSRLDRQMSNRFGEEAYAMEELVAELGASFLCAECAITNHPRPDHAGYIANWLDVLKNDKRAIFTAASKAGEATSFMVALQNMDARNALAHIEGERS